MVWNCSHCKAALVVADSTLEESYNCSKCPLCNQYEVIRKNEKATIRLDRVPRGEPLVPTKLLVSNRSDDQTSARPISNNCAEDFGAEKSKLTIRPSARVIRKENTQSSITIPSPNLSIGASSSLDVSGTYLATEPNQATRYLNVSGQRGPEPAKTPAPRSIVIPQNPRIMVAGHSVKKPKKISNPNQVSSTSPAPSVSPPLSISRHLTDFSKQVWVTPEKTNFDADPSSLLIPSNSPAYLDTKFPDDTNSGWSSPNILAQSFPEILPAEPQAQRGPVLQTLAALIIMSLLGWKAIEFEQNNVVPHRSEVIDHVSQRAMAPTRSESEGEAFSIRPRKQDAHAYSGPGDQFPVAAKLDVDHSYPILERDSKWIKIAIDPLHSAWIDQSTIQ